MNTSSTKNAIKKQTNATTQCSNFHMSERTHLPKCLSLTSLSQVHTFYKTWAETYEEDMNNLNFTSENSQFDFVAHGEESKRVHHLIKGAGLLAEMLTSALSRGGKNDVSKVIHRRTLYLTQ